MHPHVHYSFIYNSQTGIQPKCPLKNEKIKKMGYRYTMEQDSAIKRNGILPFATTMMDPEGIMLGEISYKEKQILNDFTCMWNLNKTKQKKNQVY